MKFKGLFLTAALAAAMAGGVTAAYADITYSEVVLASGAVGGDTFTNQVVVIAGNANVAATDFGNGVYQIALSSLNFRIDTDSAGEVAGGFTDGDLYVFSNRDAQTVGIGAGSDVIDTMGVSDDGLLHTMGDLFGSASGNFGHSFNTTFGSLVINSFSDDSGFDASGAITPPVTSTPEPGTWALMFAGLGMLGMALRRRQSMKAVAV